VVNETGRQVTELCDGTRDHDEIAAAIAGFYGLDPSFVADDVRSCIAHLGRAGILENVLPERAATPPRGWRLHLNLTQQCNLRCRHCAVVFEGAPTDQVLPTPEIIRILDEAADAGVEAVAFSGGEPLVRLDCLDLLEHASKVIDQVTLATNGTLIDDRIARRLVELGVTVQISVDGAAPAVHDAVRGLGSFSRTWRGIDALLRAGIGGRLGLNVTLMRPNVARALEIVELAAAKGIAGVRFNGLLRMGQADGCWGELLADPAELAETYRELLAAATARGPVTVQPGIVGLDLEPPEDGMWCRLGDLLMVDGAGDIYPCSTLTNPEFRLGNIAEMSLAEALASPALQELVARCDRRRDEVEACAACTWKSFCQGGCPGEVWQESGTFDATDRLCEIRCELYDELIDQRASRVGGQRDAAPREASDAAAHGSGH
jgi:radical SAM protein with 4Fe4S-binding SPASM domain